MASSELRNKLRASILSTEKLKPKAILVDFFGEQIEVRQPNLQAVLSISSASAEDRQSAMVDMIIAYAYVPETDERVFEESDREQLLQMPFGSDFTRLQKAISSLSNVDISTAVASKNSEATPSSST